jgi:lipopolysaccharide export system permease protein
MKILDRYVAKNFLIGYCIAFAVLIGLRIIIDFFVNLDDFAALRDLGAAAVLSNIVNYYAIHTTEYFRDFAGMITVVAAAFSLGKMTRSNELTAVMASGMSLKRVIAPIVFLAVILTGVLVVDQEVLIPNLAEQLTRAQDFRLDTEHYDIWFIADANGSLISSRKFDVGTGTLNCPTIITRRPVPDSPLIWEVTGKITADSARWNENTGGWDLKNGMLLKKQDHAALRSAAAARRANQPIPIAFYKSNITSADLPILRKDKFKNLLSSAQLAELAQRSTQIKDLAQLYSQKHFRITDPIINLIMLMVGLPVLVCREPRAMKSAILKSFSITAACFLITFVCKMLATESVFGHVMPELWAWVPIIVFMPLAFVELDSMKT